MSGASDLMSDSTAAAYDARAGEYIQVAGAIDQMADADRALIAAWRDATPGRLVDAGCGPGLWSEKLHEGNRDVLGVDLSAQFIAHARVTYPGVQFEQGSFAELPVQDASLGGILAWYSLIHTPPEDLPVILAEFARALAPGGSILIGFFDGAPRESFPHAITTAYFWNAVELSTLLEAAGFAVTASATRTRTRGEPSTRPHGHIIATRN